MGEYQLDLFYVHFKMSSLTDVFIHGDLKNIGLNTGLGLFDFLFSFDLLSLLGQAWSFLVADRIGVSTFFLMMGLGLLLLFWIIRECATWFLQTKQIAKQNQILIEKVNHLEGLLLKLQQGSVFPGGKGAINDEKVILDENTTPDIPLEIESPPHLRDDIKP